MLPNYQVYSELAQASNTTTTGRAVLQKKIMSLLRKIETCNQGVLQAWDDTFLNWQSATKHLTTFPKLKDRGDDGGSGHGPHGHQVWPLTIHFFCLLLEKLRTNQFFTIFLPFITKVFQQNESYRPCSCLPT